MKQSDYIARAPRKRGNVKYRLAAYIADWGETERTQMNSPSCTTSNLNAGDSRNEKLQARVQGLLDPKAQQAEAGDVRTGARAYDETKVSPSPLAADSGVQYMGTDSSAVTDMIEVKQAGYKALEGSYKGLDSRYRNDAGAKESLDDIANSGRCPRCQMPQQSSSSKLDTPKPMESSTAGSEGDRA